MRLFDTAVFMVLSSLKLYIKQSIDMMILGLYSHLKLNSIYFDVFIKK